MRLANAIGALLSQELTHQGALRRVAIVRVQASPWDWVLFSLTPSAERALQTLLAALAPFRAGELLASDSQPLGFHASRDFVIEALRPTDPIVQHALLDSPPEVRATLERPCIGQGQAVFLAKLRRETSLSDAAALARVVREDTWLAFRSLPARLQKRHIELTLGAQTVSIDTLAYSPIAATEIGETHVSIFPASTTTMVAARTLLENGDTSSTKLPASRVAEALGIPFQSYYGFRIGLPVDVEILSRSSEWRANDVLATLQSCSSELQAAREYCRQAIDDGIDNTLRLLEDRRRQAAHRDTVVLDDARGFPWVVGSVPTNEHEVLILAGKLEAYVRQVLPAFRIWEHTSQIGIDALADIQLSRDSAQLRNATLEFEFGLRNVFKHSHPIRQTDLVLCWSTGRLENGTHRYGDGAVDRHGSLTFEMRGEGWIRILDFGDHVIRVLVLEQLPGLRIGDPSGTLRS